MALDETSLASLWSKGQVAHPQLPIAAEVFADYLRARPGVEPSAAAEDLYLACACVLQIPGAIEQFESYVARDLDAALSKSPRAERDDLLQAIRLKLFTGDPPGLAGYSGLGSLRGWFRITASRVVLNALTRDRSPPVLDEELLLEQLTAHGDPELLAIKARLTDDFRRAVEAAFAALTPRERNLLRYAVGQGATVDQLAAVFHTHRSSAARWVAAARASFGEHLRAELEARTGASSASARRILHLVESQLELSFRKLEG